MFKLSSSNGHPQVTITETVVPIVVLCGIIFHPWRFLTKSIIKLYLLIKNFFARFSFFFNLMGVQFTADVKDLSTV